MNNIDNLMSYNDVENLRRFDNKSLHEYIDLKMKSAEMDANFIIDNIMNVTGCNKISACEIGAGNGKLLYLLEKMGRLEQGTNYEVSASRYEFAEVMKEIVGCNKVHNYNKDILKTIDGNKYDCVIAVDMVTQMITPLYDEAESKYFSWINEHLKMGGYAFFEIKKYEKEVEIITETNEPIKRWEEFPEGDPFQYGLYSINIDEDKNIVNTRLFYERATGKMERIVSVVKPYEEEYMKAILEKYGIEGKMYYCYREMGDLPQNYYLCLGKKVSEL